MKRNKDAGILGIELVVRKVTGRLLKVNFACLTV
jgi:hypothetical protein